MLIAQRAGSGWRTVPVAACLHRQQAITVARRSRTPETQSVASARRWASFFVVDSGRFFLSKRERGTELRRQWVRQTTGSRHWRFSPGTGSTGTQGDLFFCLCVCLFFWGKAITFPWLVKWRPLVEPGDGIKRRGLHGSAHESQRTPNECGTWCGHEDTRHAAASDRIPAQHEHRSPVPAGRYCFLPLFTVSTPGNVVGWLQLLIIFDLCNFFYSF